MTEANMQTDVDDAPREDWPAIRPHSTPSAMFPLGLPDLEPIPGTENYRLVSDFAVVTPDGERDDITAGFVTDGASIPGFAWLAVGHPFDPDYICEAIVHDKRWRKARTWAERTAANQRFRKVLREHGKASRWDRFALATGVWFGKLGNALAFWK
jgi:hypothetical protein